MSCLHRLCSYSDTLDSSIKSHSRAHESRMYANNAVKSILHKDACLAVKISKHILHVLPQHVQGPEVGSGLIQLQITNYVPD